MGSKGAKIVNEASRTVSYPLDTEVQTIKRSEDGHYAMEVETIDGLKYLPVGRLDVVADSKEQ